MDRKRCYPKWYHLTILAQNSQNLAILAQNSQNLAISGPIFQNARYLAICLIFGPGGHFVIDKKLKFYCAQLNLS